MVGKRQTGDVDAIALKIQGFIQRSLNEEQKKKQINTIAEKYNWERIAERTLEVYKGAI